MRKTRHFLIPVVALCALVLAACDFERQNAGPLRDDPVSIDLGNAERANIELNMGAGELALHGGSQKLLAGTFEYNIAEWKPIVHTSSLGSHATVTIQQPPHTGFGGDNRYRWDLKLNNNVLLDLALHCGAGHAQLDLGDMKLRALNVEMGAGEVQLDLRGKPSRDYDVNISGGVGQATIQLPEGVGIWAQAHGGLGSIDVTGLDKHGDHWENNLYDNSKVNVRLKVQGGIGEIRIVG